MPSHEELRAAFALFDRDGSGALNADEMRAVLSRPVGGKVSAEQVEKVIKQFDSNGDGQIQIDEFMNAFGSGSSDVLDPITYWAQQMGAFPTVDFSDLVPDGAGCEIPKTEERGINLKQLLTVYTHILRRCEAEGWTDFKKAKLTPRTVALYDCAGYVLNPATKQRQCSYIELVARASQVPTFFVSHWCVPTLSISTRKRNCLPHRRRPLAGSDGSSVHARPQVGRARLRVCDVHQAARA
jgi:hypothetical protein